MATIPNAASDKKKGNRGQIAQPLFSMYSKHLILSAARDNYPMVNKCFKRGRSLRKHKGCLMPGIFIEVMEILINRLGLTFEFFQEENKKYTADDMFNMVQNGTLDTLGHFFENASIFRKNFEVTAPLYFSSTKFTVKRADSSFSGLFDFFTVYDFYIWFGILSVFLTFSISAIFVFKLEERVFPRRSLNLSNFIWKLVRLELVQHEHFEYKFISGNTLLLIFALFQCSLLIRMYNSVITMQTVRATDPRPFKESELISVLHDRKYSFIFETKYNWWYQDILHSVSSPFYELREATKNNIIQLSENFKESEGNAIEFTNKRVAQGGWISVDTSESILKTVHSNLDCEVVYLETNFPSKSKGILLRKHHPLLSDINRVIQEEAVTFMLIYKKYFHGGLSKCHENNYRPQALGIQSFYGLLLVLLAGLSLAAFAFSIEYFVHRLRRK